MVGTIDSTKSMIDCKLSRCREICLHCYSHLSSYRSLQWRTTKLIKRILELDQKEMISSPELSTMTSRLSKRGYTLSRREEHHPANRKPHPANQWHRIKSMTAVEMVATFEVEEFSLDHNQPTVSSYDILPLMKPSSSGHDYQDPDNRFFFNNLEVTLTFASAKNTVTVENQQINAFTSRNWEQGGRYHRQKYHASHPGLHWPSR